MPHSKDTDPSLRLTRFCKDEEIGNRIYMQSCALSPQVYLGEKKAGEFWAIIMDLMKKLERAKYHLGRL